jgi:hypothetical protein
LLTQTRPVAALFANSPSNNLLSPAFQIPRLRLLLSPSAIRHPRPNRLLLLSPSLLRLLSQTAISLVHLARWRHSRRRHRKSKHSTRLVPIWVVGAGVRLLQPLAREGAAAKVVGVLLNPAVDHQGGQLAGHLLADVLMHTSGAEFRSASGGMDGVRDHGRLLGEWRFNWGLGWRAALAAAASSNGLTCALVLRSRM